MGNTDEECLHRFGRHCRAFYDSSLILHPSSSSFSSFQEEKKADEKPTDANAINIKKKEANGKIVLETLDRVSAIFSIVVGTRQLPQQQKQNNSALQESIASLRQEHTLIVERHHDLLMECGLFDVDRFMEPSCDQNEDKEACWLQKYIQMRDAMRRRAHKISMLHRQNSFFELLSESHATDTDPSKSSKPRMTQLESVQHTLSTIQKFVGKYQTNIGSHPFLAGLYRIVHLQLNPKSGSQRNSKHPSYIVRWKFRGSVLTEACRSCHGKENENDYDKLAYAREAIQVLFSFLIWVKDVDVEGGGLIMPIEENELGLDHTEPTLSFEIDKHISNANLQRILAVLPNPKRLDARATGTVEELGPSVSDPKIANDMDGSNLVSRKNVDGHDDEQWPWFARLELCILL